MQSLFLKTPTILTNHMDAHKKWCLLFKKAELVVKNDVELQRRASRGMRLKERNFPPEMVGQLYAEYCCLINKMYDAYLTSVHLQRAPYIQELISVFFKRVYELRRELELIIVNDYIYIDTALQQLHKTPFDIQIVIPYHIPVESRPDSIELLLQQMWADAYRRKFPPTPEPSESEVNSLEERRPVVVKKKESVVIINYAHINATMIQKHERFRKWFLIDHEKKYNKMKTYYAREPKPLYLREKAAALIMRIHREFMRIKREKHKEAERNILLGMIPDPFAHRISFEEENIKLYEKRRQERQRLRESFTREQERENMRLLMLRKEDQIDDITDEIYVWFREWYEGYEFFPQYPYEVEGGTLVVVRGDYPTVEEQLEEDERMKKATKGKTKEQLKDELEKELADKERQAQDAKDAAKKAAEALYKAKKNPKTDPGYSVHQSTYKADIIDALANYRASWSMYDRQPDDKDADYFYGYIKSLLSEEIMKQIHVDCRKYVDELRRLDLKLLNRAHQKMYKLEKMRWPKRKPRKMPKVPPPPKEFNVDEALLKAIQPVFDLELVTKPTRKLKDIWGDLNYAAYDYAVRDPDAVFKMPGYGDVKRRLILSCAFGSGVAAGAKRNKAVLLIGPARNGKSFLADCVAGEINAVKIDVSPEKLSAKCKRPAKVMTQVLATARAFQPSVIFMKNIERVFAKKILPQDRYLKAKKMKALLQKLIKAITDSDQIIFIATCSFPLTAKPAMMHIFNDSILVPTTDYTNLQYFFYHKLQAIRSIPRDYCVQSIAKLLAGYSFGIIFELFERVMTPERIVQLNVKPLNPLEFLNPLLEAELEPVTPEDYKSYVKFYLGRSHLKQPRIEYDIINASRAVIYEKIAAREKQEGKKDVVA